MSETAPHSRIAGRRRWQKYLLPAFLVFLAASLTLWLGGALLAASLLTGRRSPPFDEDPPTDRWPGARTIRFETSDGEEIGAWYVPGREAEVAVLLLHGNGGSRQLMLGRGELYLEDGACLLAPSLRAHGDSTGERNDFGFSARHDVIAAVGELERRCPGRPVVIQGFSLGAAAATFASVSLGERVSGYVLEAPYRDLHHAVRARTTAYLPPILDQVAYSGLLIASRIVLPHADDISPERAISGVPEGVPVLIMAGGADLRAPPDDARALLVPVREHGRLEVFENAGHESLFDSDRERYRELIRSLVSEALSRNREGAS